MGKPRPSEPAVAATSAATTGTAAGSPKSFGCSHYHAACEKWCSTCEKYWPCHVCHDEAIPGHILGRTTKLRCCHCGEEQPVGEVCTNASCGRRFACYACVLCALFDDTPGKAIFHCADCGLCRVGRAADFSHCKTCDACISVAPGPHKCTPSGIRDSCPICLEYLFDSRKPMVLLRCGHPLHHTCLTDLSRYHYRCPLCLKTIGDMTVFNHTVDAHLRQVQGPIQAALGHHVNTISLILCNDCELRSEAPFHYVYHKCAFCHGYNTTVLRTYTAPPQEEGGPLVQPTDEAVAWMDSTMLSMILLLFAVFLAVTAVVVLRQPAAAATAATATASA